MRAPWWSSNDFLQFSCPHKGHAVPGCNFSAALQPLDDVKSHKEISLLIEGRGLIRQLVPRWQRHGWWGGGGSGTGGSVVGERRFSWWWRHSQEN